MFNYFFLGALAVLLVYYLLPHRPQNVWLLLASYAFVITWSWQVAVVLFTMTLVSFGTGLWLAEAALRRRGLIWLGISLNLFALVGFRIADFFVDELVNVLGRLGLATDPGSLVFLVPIGLSYYTLQNVSYLIDVYRGQLAAERSFINFALYLAYFPKFLAGPIERARTFLPQLAQRRVVDDTQLARSLMRLAVGVGRKFLIADTLLAAIPMHIWVQPRSVTAMELWLWLGIYGAHIYNDFAGYTSLMRGVSGLFGIELSPNFSAPFFARSFSEFWSRWHISLSRWLRDYVFYPLSRWLGRQLPASDYWFKLIVPPLVTMWVSSLWHGLSAHMLVWGSLHGLFLIVEQLPRCWQRVVPPDEWPWWRQALGVLAVTALVTLAWVPFRLELPAALSFWQALVTWSGLGIQHRRLFVALVVVAASLALDWAQARHRDEFVFLRWPRLAQAGLMSLALFGAWIVAGGDGPQPFVYQGF